MLHQTVCQRSLGVHRGHSTTSIKASQQRENWHSGANGQLVGRKPASVYDVRWCSCDGEYDSDDNDVCDVLIVVIRWWV